MIRAIALITVLLVSCPADAVPCSVVKKAVVQYGEAAVESGARAKGISEKEIEKARRYLKRFEAALSSGSRMLCRIYRRRAPLRNIPWRDRSAVRFQCS
jgi:hypothetical protein